VRSASATKPKDTAKIAAAIAMAKSTACLSGRAELTRRGTAPVSSLRAAGSGRRAAARGGHG
jgi:hypothetical protein